MTREGARISIRTRIMLTMLAFILAVFAVVLLLFNHVVADHIDGTVREQLRGIVELRDRDWAVGEYPLLERLRPALVLDHRRVGPGAAMQTRALIVSTDYRLLASAGGVVLAQDLDEARALSASMRELELDLTSRELARVGAAGREYYLVSLPVPPRLLGQAAYLIYYVDMTAVAALASRINTVLLAVMATAGLVAALVAGLLSEFISRPIRDLTRLARRIGRGDFRPGQARYRDAELAELSGTMNAAAAQLQRHEAQQQVFFQNVSHELRTPLQAIRSSAEGIQHGILDHGDASRVIVSETDRLGGLVDDLLFISRLDHPSIAPTRSRCDLRELLSACAEGHRQLAVGRGLDLTFDFSQQPVVLDCDEKGMARAFSNLIANAVRYARSEVGLYCHPGQQSATIRVQDDGAGISHEHLPHIFDRFYRGPGGGHGIGLSIVQSVVQQHGGSIAVESGPEGTCFQLTFEGGSGPEL